MDGIFNNGITLGITKTETGDLGVESLAACLLDNFQPTDGPTLGPRGAVQNASNLFDEPFLYFELIGGKTPRLGIVIDSSGSHQKWIKVRYHRTNTTIFFVGHEQLLDIQRIGRTSVLPQYGTRIILGGILKSRIIHILKSWNARSSSVILGRRFTIAILSNYKGFPKQSRRDFDTITGGSVIIQVGYRKVRNVPQQCFFGFFLLHRIKIGGTVFQYSLCFCNSIGHFLRNSLEVIGNFTSCMEGSAWKKDSNLSMFVQGSNHFFVPVFSDLQIRDIARKLSSLG
mmetsp:Transcript_18398/g.33123  ORF Transcript_18398/g.33123 Transcript_18398/m.33123 type:complete len:285 (+) Transcript_18398:532-1386(+)